MPRINPTLPADGNSATATSVDTPFDTIINLLNGGLDFDNLLDGGITSSKLAAGAVGTAAVSATLAQGWLPTSVQPTVATGYNKGQKEFALTFANVDLSSVLSPGMRMKVARTGNTPTQCMGFTSASSQYATKASPSGITFTGDYTCEAWVYLLSYTGQAQVIMSKSDGTTSGFQFQIRNDGTVQTFYGGASSFTSQATMPSLPLNRWVHVAASVSVASKAISIYFNGVLVPMQTAFATGATAVTQDAVDLRLGAQSSTPANTYLNGYLSEVRLWSGTRTSTQIQDNMFTNLLGTETNLLSLFSGNGNFNDGTTGNPNGLTAVNGATAAQAANPYNATEYAIVTKVAYSAPNTTVTVFTGTNYGIPLATLASCNYSTQHAPFGWPSRSNWKVDTIIGIRVNNAGGAASTWFNLGWQLSLPTGEWDADYNVYSIITTAAGNTFMAVMSTLSTANNSASNPEFTRSGPALSISTGELDEIMYARGPLSATAQTMYYLNVAGSNTSNGLYQGTSGVAAGNVTWHTFYIRAISAYA